jgi:hypothetical protein
MAHQRIAQRSDKEARWECDYRLSVNSKQTAIKSQMDSFIMHQFVLFIGVWKVPINYMSMSSEKRLVQAYIFIYFVKTYQFKHNIKDVKNCKYQLF